MFIEEFEYLEIVLKSKNEISRWLKKLDFIPEINKPFLVHWSKLLTTSYRRIKIKVKCDDCGEIVYKDTRHFNVNDNYHLCKCCVKKGKNNPHFGKTNSEKQKTNHMKWLEEKGNPFTWSSVKEKIKQKQPESTKKGLSKRIGLKRSEETKKKMSISIKLAYKTGKLNTGTGYNNIKVKTYKDIKYQGTYELNFLKYVDSFGKLDKISRGPNIQYLSDDGYHTYLIDYMIKNTNIVFEIKSTYYWMKNEKINIIKKETAEKIYDYNLIINNNFDNVSKYFKEDIF